MRNTGNFVKWIEEEIFRQIKNKEDGEDLPNVWFEASDAVEISAQLKSLYEIVIVMFNRYKALTGHETCDICKYQEMCFKERAKRGYVNEHPT